MAKFLVLLHKLAGNKEMGRDSIQIRQGGISCLDENHMELCGTTGFPLVIAWGVLANSQHTKRNQKQQEDGCIQTDTSYGKVNENPQITHQYVALGLNLLGT
ncbi:hypothetical protein BT93_A2297 [Corymbia citriodora subsp. variegata]|nr:hypothetical protein BT93_A2297 [Corymbia citriodora subsp. variegata]